MKLVHTIRPLRHAPPQPSVPPDVQPAPDVTGPWYSLDQTFVMEPGKARLPKPPIQ